MKYLQIQENKAEEEKRDGELERNVFASNPALWVEMFSEKAEETSRADENGVFWAETPDELEEIAKEWEEEGWSG